ncbi:MAG: tetratricopeptide repeat protein [Bryobacteraceae bacterium]
MRAKSRAFVVSFAALLAGAVLLSGQAAAPTDHLALGTALDLEGKYSDARKEIQKGIDAAPSPTLKQQAQRTMAISYAFEHNASEAAKYEQQVFDSHLAAQQYYEAGEIADELARIFLESGDFDNAYQWYRTGYETGLKQTGITESRKNVWGFRWENAQARIAARRGNREEAQKHIEAAKAYLDKASDPQQQSFYPYLTGYAHFYAGDYKAAIADLQNANQRDPFILSLLAQAYEKLGDKTQAMDYYRKVLTFNMHNPANAFARPLARQKLG